MNPTSIITSCFSFKSVTTSFHLNLCNSLITNFQRWVIHINWICVQTHNLVVSDKVQLDKDKTSAVCLIVLIETEHEVDIVLGNCDHLLGFEFHVMTFLVVSHTQSQSVYHTWWNHTRRLCTSFMQCNLWVCTVNRFSFHPWCVAWKPLVSASLAQFFCPGVLVNSGPRTLTGKRGCVKANWLRPSTVTEAFARAGAAVVGSSLELFQYISCLTVRLLEKHLQAGSESRQNGPWKCEQVGGSLDLAAKSTHYCFLSLRRLRIKGLMHKPWHLNDCFRCRFEPVDSLEFTNVVE